MKVIVIKEANEITSSHYPQKYSFMLVGVKENVITLKLLLLHIK